jgi:hypothetical protein
MHRNQPVALSALRSESTKPIPSTKVSNIRPTNGRSDDQVRRNHSIQYYSYPDFKFDRLRKEAPERYESYADMAPNEWITLKIVVKGQEANLYLNDAQQPALIVKDLKHGGSGSGGIGLWVQKAISPI